MNTIASSVADDILNRSRGAEELAKLERAARITLEAVLALCIVAIVHATSSSFLVHYSPLLFVCAPFALALLEASYDQHLSFARRARRASLRLCAGGTAIIGLELIELQEECPRYWRLALRLRGLELTTVDAYYAPKRPEGRARLQELYAHSAFFSARILRHHSRVMTCLALSVLLIALAVVLVTTVAPLSPQAEPNTILDIVYSVVLGVVAARMWHAARGAGHKERRVDGICRGLLQANLTDEQLERLIDEYDIERAQGSLPSTALYKKLRRQLSADWATLQAGAVEGAKEA
jgi:hypothetical protein